MNGSDQRQGWWLWSVNPLAILLWPLSLIFCALVRLRRSLFSAGWLQVQRLPIPVIVVGNISVGGSGKTPVVVELIKLLKHKGYQPGILTRGYKSDHEAEIQLLDHGEREQRVGDEANLLSDLCQCPIAVAASRYQAGLRLLDQHPQLDCLVCDDGLQHYSLYRDVEVIVKRDSALGNKFCLPAGPLREPLSRFSSADVLIDRDGAEVKSNLGECWNLFDKSKTRTLNEFKSCTVHALAGVAFPESFFNALQDSGINVIPHAYPDHHSFELDEIDPLLDQPLLVTHKDAVKLEELLADADIEKDIWVVPLELVLSDDLQYALINHIESKLHG